MGEGNKFYPEHLPQGTRIFLFVCSLVFVFGFLAFVAWFRIVDVYQKHFFDSGWLIAGYNGTRIIFIGYLFWVLYATGCIVLDLLRARTDALPILERIVVASCVGTAIWHLLALIIGLCGLLYWQLAAALTFFILVLSMRPFQIFLLATWSRIRYRSRLVLDAKNAAHLMCIAILVFSAAVLLITRGLYPGGGHDYYTHYFYYYHDVIANHGISPNDVWYHYYYSKGAGLFFWAILLTDPQAPELVSFCLVVIASIGLAAVASRVAPDSDWAPAAAGLYLLFYIVSLAGPPYSNAGPGGEFQKLHELTSSSVVLVVCFACLASIGTKECRWIYLVAAISTTITASILTPAIGVLLVIVFAGATFLSALRRGHAAASFYFALSVSASLFVGITLVQNYLVTGLVSDQMIELTWRWANVERLNDWGVVAMVVLTAWIRHNYAESIVPLGLPTLKLVADYVRWSALWPLLVTGIFAGLWTCQRRQNPAPNSMRVFFISAAFSIAFAALAIFFGRSQTFSFFRLGTFFFPLLVLAGLSGCASLRNDLATRQLQRSLLSLAPIAFLIGLPVLWSFNYDWSRMALASTRYAIKFLVGDFSLAEAYSHQARRDGAAYGAIHPGTLEAARHAGFGVRIWSMHIHSYCMAPECRIESVVSFKMSRHYNDILNGAPDKAEALLKKEGLNFFLVSKDLVLVDALPYSSLFSPQNIAKYLAVRWTDGKTYLLTWPDATTEPIPPDFIDFYRQKVEADRRSVFNFDKAVPQLGQMMSLFEQSPHPWKPIQFPWKITNTAKSGQPL